MGEPQCAHEQIDVCAKHAFRRDVGLPAVPDRSRVAEAEQRERGHARVEIGPELTRSDALLDDALDGALVPQLERANALARRPGQETPLAQEDEREIEPLRGSVTEQDLRDLFRGARVAPGDAEKSFDVRLVSIPADGLERGLLGIEVVVEARLPDAEDIRDVLGGATSR